MVSEYIKDCDNGICHFTSDLQTTNVRDTVMAIQHIFLLCVSVIALVNSRFIFEDALQKRTTGGTINLCILCDVKCKGRITAAGTTPTAFFTAVTTKVSKAFSTLDPDLKVTFGGVTELAQSINMMDYTSSKDTAGFGAANLAFWQNRIESFRSRGCDSSFAVISNEDPIFSGGSVIAIANMMAMCKSNSHGLAKYYSSKGTMAGVIAHEMGHQVGAYHDGELNSAYANSALRSRFAEAFAKLDEACTSSVPAMKEMYDMAVGVRHQFTSCSKAYYNMWRELAGKYSPIYDTSCLDDSRRTVRQEGNFGDEGAPSVITDHGLVDIRDLLDEDSFDLHNDGALDMNLFDTREDDTETGNDDPPPGVITDHGLVELP